MGSSLENVQRAMKARRSRPATFLSQPTALSLRRGKAPGESFIHADVYKEIRVYTCGVRLSLWPPGKGSLCQVSYSAGVRKWEWTGSAGSSSGRHLLIKLRKPSRKFFKSKNHTSQIKAPSTNGSSPLPDFNSEGNSLCCRLYSSLSHCY